MGFPYPQHIKVEIECVEEAEIYEGYLSRDNFIVNWSQSFNSIYWIIAWWLRWKRIYLQYRRTGLDPWVRKILENSMDEKAGGLQSKGSQGVGHYEPLTLSLSLLLCAWTCFTCIILLNHHSNSVLDVLFTNPLCRWGSWRTDCDLPN